MIRLFTSNEQLFRQQRNRSLSRESISIFLPGVIYVEPEVTKEIELQSIVIKDGIKKDEEIVNDNLENVKMSKSIQTENTIEKYSINFLKLEFAIGFIECLFLFGFLFESKLLFTIPMLGFLVLIMYIEYVRRNKNKSEIQSDILGLKNDIKIENKIKSVGKHRVKIKFLNINKKSKNSKKGDNIV